MSSAEDKPAAPAADEHKEEQEMPRVDFKAKDKAEPASPTKTKPDLVVETTAEAPKEEPAASPQKSPKSVHFEEEPAKEAEKPKEEVKAEPVKVEAPVATVEAPATHAEPAPSRTSQPKSPTTPTLDNLNMPAEALSGAPKEDAKVKPGFGTFHRDPGTSKDSQILVDRQAFLLKNLHTMKDELAEIDREVNRLFYQEKLGRRRTNVGVISIDDGDLADDEFGSYLDPGKKFKSRFLGKHRTTIEPPKRSHRHTTLDDDS